MQKNKYIFKNIASVLSNKYFNLFLVISMFVVGYFCTTLKKDSNYLESLCFSLTFQQFITLGILPLLILGDILMIKFFEGNGMLLMYFKNKKRYIKELLKHIVGINSYLFLLLMIIILTCFNLFSNQSFILEYKSNYEILNLIYTFFIVIKLYLLVLFTSILLTLMTYLWNRQISLIFIVLFSSSLFLCAESYDQIDKIYKMPLYIGNYFLSTIEYNSFSLQCICFFFIFFLYSMFLFLIYKWILKRNKDLIYK